MDEKLGNRLAEMYLSNRIVAKNRSAECSDAKRSVEKIRPLDCKRLANSSQQTSCPIQRQRGRSTDVVDFCEIRGRHSGNQETSHDKKRVDTVGVTQSNCGESLHSEIGTNMVNAGRPTGAITTENVMRLLDFQQYSCALTGRMLTPQTASLDHIVPIRFGGAHCIENAQILHKDVNRAKNSLTNEQFIRMCREIVEFVSHPEHKN